MGKFKACDYVTLREEPREGGSEWTEASVGRARLKSVPGRVVRSVRRQIVQRIRAALGIPEHPAPPPDGGG
jgi:hypothetical protein